MISELNLKTYRKTISPNLTTMANMFKDTDIFFVIVSKNEPAKKSSKIFKNLSKLILNNKWLQIINY
jgi:hypothetical protein